MNDKNFFLMNFSVTYLVALVSDVFSAHFIRGGSFTAQWNNEKSWTLKRWTFVHIAWFFCDLKRQQRKDFPRYSTLMSREGKKVYNLLSFVWCTSLWTSKLVNDTSSWTSKLRFTLNQQACKRHFIMHQLTHQPPLQSQRQTSRDNFCRIFPVSWLQLQN